MLNNKHIFPKLRYQTETRLFKLGVETYFRFSGWLSHLQVTFFTKIKRKKEEIIYCIYKKIKTIIYFFLHCNIIFMTISQPVLIKIVWFYLFI